MKIIKLLLLIFSIQSATNLLYSQEVEKKEMAKLSFLIGNWAGNSYSYSKNDTTKVKVNESANYILDGNAITLDVHSSSVQLHTLITYSVQDSCYYYQPTSKTESYRKSKGDFKDGKFIIYFDNKSRLIFEKTENGEFHEYGERFKEGVWKKYFEDILQPTVTNYSFASQKVEKSKFKKTNIGGEPTWSYSEATKITDYSELLFISGQIPVTNNGNVPNNIKDQCEVAWSNIEAQLKKGNMTLDNLVKVTFFVSDRKYLKEVGKLRKKKLLNIKPALTIIITGIYNENWLLEIEAIAAK